MTFYESRVALNFDASWSVVPFDQTRYFKALAGQGLRGVDFLGIREQTLFLIEIKNYSPAKKAKHYPYGTVPGELVAHLREKFADSLRIVRIIESTLQRYLLYRTWRLIIRYLSWLKPLGPSDWLFWTRCADLSSRGSVREVLILIDPLGKIPTDQFPTSWQVIPGQPPCSPMPGLVISGMGTMNRA